MSLLYQRARNSGSCPPLILLEECSVFDSLDGFEMAMNKVIDDNDFCLRPGQDVAKDLKEVLERVKISDSIIGTFDTAFKQKIVDYRRCIVLAVVGCTQTESTSLASVVLDGYLRSIKVWLDDILSPPLGSVDMLLHLLLNITNLPVTKASIKDSGMGITIGAIGKHAICKDTPNENAIKERINQLKDSWNSSVKARKVVESSKHSSKKEASKPSSPPSEATKRGAPDSASPDSPVKRLKKDVEQKVDPEPKKATLFNSLIKAVKSGSPNGIGTTGSGKVHSKPNKSVVASVPSVSAPFIKENSFTTTVSNRDNMVQDSKSKKIGLRVKWADHFGGQLLMSQEVESEAVDKPSVQEAPVSWSDRKRRDRLREKELLTKAKNSKLLDDEDLSTPAMMKANKPWLPPLLLPERINVVQPILNSAEYTTQESRISSIAQTRYSTDFDVPLNPDPLSDVEQALDMTSQASAVVSQIPFFAPQLAIPTSAVTESYAVAAVDEHVVSTSTPPAQNDKASFEFVQSLGLPFYLVGQPVEVIQTLAGNPSLLNTLLDANGMYDQQKLMSLVQTMTSTGALPNPVVSYQSTSTNPFGVAFNANPYGDPAPPPPQNTRTITRKSDDGNLHVSGYGPGISESDLIAAFSPYVRVDEVVLKGTFAFVNTSDPVNAQRAREALTGTLLNGMPIRINNATRKIRDTGTLLSVTPPPPPAIPPFSQPRQSTFGSIAPTAMTPAAPSFSHPSFGAIHPNIDSVRDDKGNAPTKNLFVAGYGQGTNEQMLRDLFGQFAVVTGVVSKGTFAFVNTSDRHGAVVAREHLGGTMFNGGILRINFAKETGRLGTSFDLTYGRNPAAQSINQNHLVGTASAGRQPNMGYYG